MPFIVVTTGIVKVRVMGIRFVTVEVLVVSTILLLVSTIFKVVVMVRTDVVKRVAFSMLTIVVVVKSVKKHVWVVELHTVTVIVLMGSGQQSLHSQVPAYVVNCPCTHAKYVIISRNKTSWQGSRMVRLSSKRADSFFIYTANQPVSIATV
jgi:hypothetical protein